MHRLRRHHAAVAAQVVRHAECSTHSRALSCLIATAAVPPTSHCAASIWSRRCFSHTTARKNSVASVTAAPSSTSESPSPECGSSSGVPAAAAAADRFRELDHLLNECSTDARGDRWREAVRALAEMRQLTLRSHTTSLTLGHFHAVLRALLHGCTAHDDDAHTLLGTNLHYPSHMRASQFNGDLASFCMGVSHDDTPIDGAPPAPPGYVRQHFRPDFRAYHRLIRRIDTSFKPRDSAGHTSTLSVDSRENMWMLIMALEADKQPRHAEDEGDEADSTMEEGGVEVTTPFVDADDDTVSSVSSSPLPPPRSPSLPSLALVRHIFSALAEVDLQPTCQTINYVLAVFDAHARASQSEEDAAAIFDLRLTDSPTAPVSMSPPDMEYIWKLWTDLDRVHHVHPDLLSQLLMLRICFRHHQYGYMGRVLSDASSSARLLAAAKPILNGHVFFSPRLILDALTHSSKVSTNVHSNERMEFLGDSVIDVLVREMLVEVATRRLARGHLSRRAKSDDANADAQPSHTFRTMLQQDLLPSHLLAQVKGKYVSHRLLSDLSRKIGLSDLLLAANTNTRSAAPGWLGQRANEANHPKRRMHRRDSWAPRTAPRDSSPYQPLSQQVPDRLAEDVFEACVAALFLDTPNDARNEDAAASGKRATEFLPTPDVPSTQTTSTADFEAAPDPDEAAAAQQAYGVSAVRAFLRRSMGRDLSNDCEQALNFYDRRQSGLARSRGHRGPPSRQTSVAAGTQFDHRVNYKRMLELHVRATYTDEAGVCHAHVLYATIARIGAHLYRVRAIIKVLPSGRTDAHRLRSRDRSHTREEASFFRNYSDPPRTDELQYVALLQRMERQRETTLVDDPLHSHDDKETTLPATYTTISFSVSPTQVPLLHADFDREFPSASESPDQVSAEQTAAFHALKAIGVIGKQRQE